MQRQYQSKGIHCWQFGINQSEFSELEKMENEKPQLCYARDNNARNLETTEHRGGILDF